MSDKTSNSRLRTFLISGGEEVTIGHICHSGMSNLPAPHAQLHRNASHENSVERLSAVESHRWWPWQKLPGFLYLALLTNILVLCFPYISSPFLYSIGCYGCHVNEIQHINHELSDVTDHFHAKSYARFHSAVLMVQLNLGNLRGCECARV